MMNKYSRNTGLTLTEWKKQRAQEMKQTNANQKARKGVDSGVKGKLFELYMNTLFTAGKSEYIVKPINVTDTTIKINGVRFSAEVKSNQFRLGSLDDYLENTTAINKAEFFVYFCGKIDELTTVEDFVKNVKIGKCADVLEFLENNELIRVIHDTKNNEFIQLKTGANKKLYAFLTDTIEDYMSEYTIDCNFKALETFLNL